ncbi:MotB family protein [Lentilitoribacter sp. Alg239-R112]|uniref:MotB family protein n=1 Tax=Lentilitoribacter sp. Alg239-R112 TaxID=2305987 RepID=UPI0013A6A9F0|nr:MotB family protein [Lentilitoribacter sp. Alg239-R112]
MSDETSTHQGQGEIIIVKKVQGGGGGHHGGAWKIAYADFVTAMMAFFLVMWLVNAANEDTKASVASYFNPIKLTDSTPASKDVKKQSGDGEKEKKSEADIESDGTEKTQGDGSSDGEQEGSAAGEESENSEANYFENPYAVLSEIVMEAAEESNISEKGDGGAQTSGSATGASGGEAYRDPFDPDFWTKQVSNNPENIAETAESSEATDTQEGQETAKSNGNFELDLGAGDVFDKNAGAGDNERIGAGLSDHDTGGRKTGLSQYDGEKGGQPFAEEGRHITDLPENDKTSDTLPEGNTNVDEIDPTKLATLFEKGNKELDRLIEEGVVDRLTTEEAEELLELVKEDKEQKLGSSETERMGELLAKNDAAKEGVKKISELQTKLDEIETRLQEIAKVETAQAQMTEAQKLESEIKSGLGGSIGKLSEGIEVASSEGGLLLSLTDQSNVGMFNIGSAVPKRDMILVMEKIGNILRERDGSIVIRGHTDARPFSTGGNDNWRLSMSRAHSAYFMLVRGGIPEDRITQVSGFADRRLKVPDDPYSELNRRIEILIEAQEG